MKSVIENNKLIANFMGREVHTDNISWFDENFKRLKYDDWNSLMPVINNINSRGIHKGDEGFDLIEVIWGALTDVSIRGVYDAVVEFIKWYNEKELGF